MNSRKSVLMARLAVWTIVLSFALPSGVFGQDFLGSEACKTCHEDQYNEWKTSGHPFKLMKGQNAQHRPIPLPRGNDWPEGETAAGDEVSYVIGGYKWKSRYIDKDGYIITVTEDESGLPVDGANQYNYLTGQWSNYHAGEAMKPYDCGSCHTTNWVADEDAETDNDLSDNQDGLPGMWGTFDVGGIHCEQCHGNSGGEGHMTGEDRIDKSAEACGVCHYREASPEDENFVNVIPASGGFVKHHEQYNEHLAGPHSGLDCVTCHNPHKRGEYSIKEGFDCESCHVQIAASYATTSMYDYNVECTDCHMPLATKSAQPTGPFAGDVMTHLFYINTDPTASMFTPEGDYVALDDEGKGAVTLDFACKSCHETTELPELARFAKNFHGMERDDNQELLPELFYAGINPGLTGNWWGGQPRNGEGFLLEVSYSNNNLVLTGSFYTYDTEGNQIWLIGYGVVQEGSNTAIVNLSITSGPTWGADYDPTAVSLVAWGTAEFLFTSCGEAMVSFVPNAEQIAAGYTEHGYDLKRDLTVPGISCPVMDNNPN